MSALQNQLDTLLALSHALHGALAAHELESLQGLLEERGKLIVDLEAELDAAELNPAQVSTLREALELGRQSRLPLAARRETAREDLSLLRRKRQNQQALKPAAPTGRRLNVSG